jgi:hypothetical protein
MKQWNSRVDLLTVYISEAHAMDTSPLGLPIKYNQTHNIEQRAAVAKDFIKHNNYEFPILLDVPPQNEFDKLFAAWPLRFYVIENGRLNFICEPYGEYVLISDLNSYFKMRFGPRAESV